MQIQELIAMGAERLKSSNSQVPRQESRWLFMHTTGVSAAQLISKSDDEVKIQHFERFNELIGRRVLGEPFQYIIGRAEFRGISLRVDPRVLIPRPETELLVDIVLETAMIPRPRILDVGTGSGCVAIALKKECPSADVVAIDSSQDALDVANRNAIETGFHIETKLVDILCETAVDSLGTFDFVVSNPPYIPASEIDLLEAEVRHYEPLVALSPGQDPLLFYQRLAAISAFLVRPFGYVVVEIHSDFADDVISIFRQSGLSNIQLYRDIAEKDRVVTGQIAY